MHFCFAYGTSYNLLIQKYILVLMTFFVCVLFVSSIIYVIEMLNFVILVILKMIVDALFLLVSAHDMRC